MYQIRNKFVLVSEVSLHYCRFAHHFVLNFTKHYFHSFRTFNFASNFTFYSAFQQTKIVAKIKNETTTNNCKSFSIEKPEYSRILYRYVRVFSFVCVHFFCSLYLIRQGKDTTQQMDKKKRKTLFTTFQQRKTRDDKKKSLNNWIQRKRNSFYGNLFGITCEMRKKSATEAKRLRFFFSRGPARSWILIWIRICVRGFLVCVLRVNSARSNMY